MNPLLDRIRSSPTLVRVAPFALFVALTAAQEFSGTPGRFWLYLLKSAAVGWLLWTLREALAEMRWRFTWEAVVVGVGVFLMWVGLDPCLGRAGLAYPKLNPRAAPWNPFAVFGPDTVLGWLFVAGRLAGSTLVVPPLEEVFYRSFFYRYLARPDFLSVPLNRFAAVPFVATALVFGLSHREWLAGMLCACAYQGLVLWKNRLGDAIAAHALTNFLLGLWVIGRGQWQYW